MEPPRKRQRLLEPAHTLDAVDNNIQLEPYNPLEDFDADDDYEDYDEDELGFDYGELGLIPYNVEDGNRDFDLAERRARVDQKLKSNWEKLFEKYSKDFTGIGDEVDLATGEIVVDNGHLRSMEDEGDVGYSVDGRRLLRALTVEPEGLSALVPLPEGGDGGHSGSVSEDEDENVGEDLIRNSIEQHQESGFGAEEPNASRDAQRANMWGSPGSNGDSTALSVAKKVLPSREEILEQFGEFGPQVIQLLGQQQGNQNQDRIEPAWRAPELPSQFFGQRPVLQTVFLQEPDDERSPSPERGTSLWAYGHAQNGSGRKGVPFSKQDDEILLREMTKSMKPGQRVKQRQIFADIAARYPQHTASEWYDRWDRAGHQSTCLVLGKGQEGNSVGLDWEAHGNSNRHASTTVEFVKRVIHTKRPGKGQNQNTDKHTFMGVVISETNRETPRSASRRFQELSSHQLGTAGSRYRYEDGVLLPRSPSQPKSTPTAKRSPRASIFTKRPHWQISSHIESKHTASQDLFEKLKSVFARPVRSKHLASLQLEPGEQYVSFGEGDQELHLRLIRCPHPRCQKGSKLYRGARIENEHSCEFILHLKDDHDVSMYPCLEAGCERKGGNGFRTPGQLIRHVKAEHNCTESWNRLRRIIDAEKLASIGICVETDGDAASAADSVDELQDETSGLGIQMGSINAEDYLPPQRPLPKNSTNRTLSAEIHDVEQAGSMAYSSSPKEFVNEATFATDQEPLPNRGNDPVDAPSDDHEAGLLEMGSRELPSTNEETIGTADKESSTQVVSHTMTRSSSIANGVTQENVLALSSVLASSPKTPVQPSSSGRENELLEIDSHSPAPIVINSSPPKRYSLRNFGISDLSIRPKPKTPATKPKSSQSSIPDSAAPSFSPQNSFITPQKPSPKKPFVYAPRRSLPFEIADEDELDELSILSPSLTPSLMTCHSVTMSRTTSRVSSPFHTMIQKPSSVPKKKSTGIGHPRYSLPMSAIPPRSVQKSTHGSLSAYKAPSSSLRRMIMPSTPTKKNRKSRRVESEIMGEVVKTPGGTLRRCGQEGFFCGKEFCFRCVRDGK